MMKITTQVVQNLYSNMSIHNQSTLVRVPPRHAEISEMHVILPWHYHHAQTDYQAIT